ncbi:MAG: CoA transferase [Gammaproteobacteria bacterium]|nr:CoA transferase [Gammaproteobacteria bacterium]
MAGPLAGLKIVEMVGIGPAPFCAMLLADMGAEVIRIDRSGSFDASGVAGTCFDVLSRSRKSLCINLKKPGAREVMLELIAQADGLIEGFRPGAMERMGLGPEDCLAVNPRLVYGRMTGWGQTGPLAKFAGHDINYIAVSGILNMIGKPGEAPIAPVNFLGDFGGGGMLLAFGLLAALLEAKNSGKGQVVDAAMAEGASLLAAMTWGYRAAGFWKDERGTNIIDGGAHFYGTYLCADGRYIAVGAVEPQFYAQLCARAGLTDPEFQAQMDAGLWPQLKVKMAQVFLTKTQAEWCELMQGADACFSPVLDWNDAPLHEHNLARQSFVEVAGVVQPAPAPRYSRTQPDSPLPAVAPGTHTTEILTAWGISAETLAELQRAGVIQG